MKEKNGKILLGRSANSPVLNCGCPNFHQEPLEFSRAEACESFFEATPVSATGFKEKLFRASSTAQKLEAEIARLEGAEGSLSFNSFGQLLFSLLEFAVSQGDYLLSVGSPPACLHYIASDISTASSPKLIEVPGDEHVGQSILDAVEHQDSMPGAIYMAVPGGAGESVADIEKVADIAAILGAEHGEPCPLAIDNSRLGPWFQNPLKSGANIVLASTREYIGGDVKLHGGHLSGRAEEILYFKRIREERSWFMSARVASLAEKALETGFLRKQGSSENARKLATMLSIHPGVKKVCHPSLYEEGSASQEIFSTQAKEPGATVSFDLESKEKAYSFLNHLKRVIISPFYGRNRTVAFHSRYHQVTDIYQGENFRGAVTMVAGVERFQETLEDVKNALKALV